MKSKNLYIIDASSLIELERHNPIDVYPSVWASLRSLIQKGFLISHKEVYKEIKKKDSKLYNWAKNQKGFFKEITKDQIEIVREILAKYPSIVKADRPNGADAFVIALAVEITRRKQKILFPVKKIVVTEEKERGNQVRIPFICKKDYNIECIYVIDMFRTEGLRF